MEEKLTCHLCNSPLDLDDYDLAKNSTSINEGKTTLFSMCFLA